MQSTIFGLKKILNPTIHHRVQSNPCGSDWTFKITYLLIKSEHNTKLTQTIWLVHQTNKNKSKFIISYNYVGISSN